jgi:hypothetical protein
VSLERHDVDRLALHPTRRAKKRDSLPIEGGDGVRCTATADMRAPFRDAGCVRGMRGLARRKAQVW